MQAVRDQLKGRPDADVQFAGNIITTLREGGMTRCQIDRKPGFAFVVVGDKSGGECTQGTVQALQALSQRVTQVTLQPERGHVCVFVAEDHPGYRAYRPPTHPLTPTLATDWAAGGVTDLDDQHNISKCLQLAMNVAPKMPLCQHWYEPIGHEGAARHGVPIPYTTDVSESGGDGGGDVSESTGDIPEHIPESDRVGYAVCVQNLPTFNGDFLNYLKDQFGDVLVQAYLWFGPPTRVADGAVLVCVLRRTMTTRGQVKQRKIRGVNRRPSKRAKTCITPCHAKVRVERHELLGGIKGNGMCRKIRRTP